MLGPENRGVAGAQVLLAATTTAGGEVVARATTGEDGRFAVRPLAPGAYDLLVRAAGLRTVAVPGIPVDGKPPFDLGTVRMTPGETLAGHVVDTDGAAVPGARVTVEPPPAAAALRWHPDSDGDDAGALGAPLEAVTAADGSFRLEGLPPDLPARLHAEAEGHVPSGPVLVRLPPEGRIEIRLEPGVRVRGRVVAPDGRGIPGAAVEIAIVAAKGSPPVRTTAQEDGDFALVVRPGRAALRARASGYAPAEVRGIDIPRTGPADELEVVLLPGATLTGRVTDAGGHPLQGARVGPALDGEDASGTPPVVSDPEGVYRLEGLAPGEQGILVWAEGHAPEHREAALEPGENRLDLALESQGGAVEGRVHGPSGGIAAAALRLERLPDGFPVRRATSSEDGAFLFAAVPAGEYRVTARAPGHVSGATDPFALTKDRERTVDVRLEASSEVTGRILGVEPDALAAVVVEARGGGSLPLPGAVRYDGTYRIDGLTPGHWTIHAELPGAGRTAAASVEVLPGASHLERDLDFQGGHTLTGEVLVDGRAVPGARVEATGPRGGTATYTDAWGRFLLTGLPGGETLLTVRVPDTGLSREWRLDLARDQEVRFDLETASDPPAAGGGYEPRRHGATGSKP